MKKENDIKILNITSESSSTQSSIKLIRYAWGNSTLKTWFITKNKNVFLPKGCKLIFILSGEKTNDIIQTTDTYPKIGDVISDIDDSRIKISDVSWI